jgi:hypothetical protein
MKNEYSVKEKLMLALLATGVCCFGFIFPVSPLSDHYTLVHFAAHFGMSFLIALCFYMVCTIKLRFSKSFTYTILIIATLFIGVVYKFWEIVSHGEIGTVPFPTILDRAGVMTSMSQNLSGLMAAMFLIESLLNKNLVITVVKTGKSLERNFHIGSISNNVHDFE